MRVCLWRLIGRFGPYVKLGKLFVSYLANLSPYDITLGRSYTLLRQSKRLKPIRIATFGEGEEQVMVLNGRFGPYISYQKRTIKNTENGRGETPPY